jgi:hypothetical protein
MHKDLFLEYMQNWARWMKSEDHKLGFPQRSIGMAGASSTSFDDMIEEADSEIVRTINSCIDSLGSDEVNAIWARYIGTKKPMYYEMKLQIGLDKLQSMVEARVQI